MNNPYPTFLIGSQASPPGVAAMASILLCIVIDVAAINYCLDDMRRRVIVTGRDKRFWTAVIIVGGPLGQIAYWIYGRGPY